MLWQLKIWIENEVPPRFELGSLDSKSRVLTITPWDHSFKWRGTKYKTKNSIFVHHFETSNKQYALCCEQSGAVEACWAHNPEVRGSKPRSATIFFFLFSLFPPVFQK